MKCVLFQSQRGTWSTRPPPSLLGQKEAGVASPRLTGHDPRCRVGLVLMAASPTCPTQPWHPGGW